YRLRRAELAIHRSVPGSTGTPLLHAVCPARSGLLSLLPWRKAPRHGDRPVPYRQAPPPSCLREAPPLRSAQLLQQPWYLNHYYPTSPTRENFQKNVLLLPRVAPLQLPCWRRRQTLPYASFRSFPE